MLYSCSLSVGRRHENKDEEERRGGRGGRGDSWMAALYASEKEMFSKWLDESFRETRRECGGGFSRRRRRRMRKRRKKKKSSF